MTGKLNKKYRGKTTAFGRQLNCTTNFVDWQEGVTLDYAIEIEALYGAIESGERVGKFNIEVRGKNLFVMPVDGELVLILTPKSRDAFLRRLKPLVETCKSEMHGGLDDEQWAKLSLREKIAKFKQFHIHYS